MSDADPPSNEPRDPFPEAPLSRAIEIGGEAVEPGERADIELRVERLASGPWISLPLIVLNGRRDGPRFWLSAAVHGDEVNGVEIIRRVIQEVRPEELAGSVIAVPVVNELGFMHGTRYLPDRRDLNRAFPGSASGSLASRIANLLMTEVVEGCDYGIDLHSGSNGRANLPQIRANLEDAETRHLAEGFCAPVALHSENREGALRAAAAAAGARVLLYEGGETERFNDYAVRAGTAGVLRVLNLLRMTKISIAEPKPEQTLLSGNSTWVRADRGGLLRLEINLGDQVVENQVLGHVCDIYGRKNLAVRSSRDGIVIGAKQSALVNQGDALVHVAAIHDESEFTDGAAPDDDIGEGDGEENIED